MIIVISAIIIFILLYLSAILAFIVPLKTSSNTQNDINANVEEDSVLTQLFKTSKNIPSVIQYLNW